MGINGRSIDPCSASEAEQQAYATRISEQLRGEPGTTLTLRVKRPTSGRDSPSASHVATSAYLA